MSKQSREIGKQLRKIEKLDKAWRAGGKQEGKTENELARHLGRAHRDGLGAKARRMQDR